VVESGATNADGYTMAAGIVFEVARTN
jgi:hypothetical protein